MIWEIDDRQRRVEGLDEDGRPDPAYAASLGLVRAPFGRRALATLIEVTVFALLSLPYLIGTVPVLVRFLLGDVGWYGVVESPTFIVTLLCAIASSVLVTAFAIVQIVLHGKRGVTLGKAVVGIRSVQVATLEAPGFGRAFLRALTLWASFAVPIIGPALVLASPLFDPSRRGRGWLDVVGRTWFVDISKGLDPYDVKRMRIARKTFAADPVSEQPAMPSLATPDALGGDPGYRPGARASAGVIGVARPHAPGRQPVVGIGAPGDAGATGAEQAPFAPPPQPYRPGQLSGLAPSAPPAPAWGPPPAAPPASASPAPAWGHPPAAPAASAPTSPPAAPAWAPPPPPVQSVPQQSAPQQQPENFQAQPPSAPAPEPTWGRSAQQQTPHPPLSEETIHDVTQVRSPADADDDVEATRVTRPRGFAVVFEHGQRVPITGLTLLGRNPAVADGESAQLVPVDDDSRSMSKTHVAVRPGDGYLEVTDRFSTNGTAVIRAGSEHPVASGAWERVDAGEAIRFGDRMARVEHV